MPPKKEAEEAAPVYPPLTVLPLCAYEPARAALRLSVNYKRNLTLENITQLMKEKGLTSQMVVNGTLTSNGLDFVSSNLSVAVKEFVAALKKPPEPKKDKKDTKKDTKTPTDTEETEKTIEYSFEKKCSEFVFIHDIPRTVEDLQKALKGGLKIDIVLWVTQQTRPGSKKPNYELLNRTETIDSYMNAMEASLAISSNNQRPKTHESKDQQTMANILRIFYRHKSMSSEDDPLNEAVLIRVPFLVSYDDDSKDVSSFLEVTFTKLCEVTLKKSDYDQWKHGCKKTPMIPPQRHVTRKEVPIQEKKEDKKAAKKQKQPTEPAFEIIEQVTQIYYESFPANIRSDLTEYKRFASYTKGLTSCSSVLDTILQSFCPKRGPSDKRRQALSEIKDRHGQMPMSTVKPNNVSLYSRQVKHPCIDRFDHKINIKFPTNSNSIELQEFRMKAHDHPVKITIEALLYYLHQLAKKSIPNFQWDFSDRTFYEQLTAENFRSSVCLTLLKDPQIFGETLDKDGIKLLIMTQVNPPGRILFHNFRHLQKCSPSFDAWLRSVPTENNYLTYDWKKAGNLTAKCQYMMPADNAVLEHSVYTVGDDTFDMIKVALNQSLFGLKTAKKGYMYWHHFNGLGIKLTTEIEDTPKITDTEQSNLSSDSVPAKEGEHKNEGEHTPEGSKKTIGEKVVQWLQMSDCTMQLDPYPLIYWKDRQAGQVARQISCMGQVHRFLADGSVEVYFPNGDIWYYSRCAWIKHGSPRDGLPNDVQPLKETAYFDGQYKVRVRADRTFFVEYPNGDRLTVFPDETRVLFRLLPMERVEIQQRGIIIRVCAPKIGQENVIGHGSAFAYLGAHNVLERSCDGYLFELWAGQLSYHVYCQKFDKEDQVTEQEVRLLCFRTGEILKIVGPSICYIPQSIKDQHQKWLQLFTPITQQQSSIYNANLTNGSIHTKDMESNSFTLRVGQQADVNIAVSFIREQDQKDEQFPTGFYVPKQNYFLPLTSNSLPARLFALRPDGSAIQFLSETQLSAMNDYYIETSTLGERQIRQFSKEKVTRLSPSQVPFSQFPHVSELSLPPTLVPTQTPLSRNCLRHLPLYHRVVSSVEWNKDFSEVKTLIETIQKQAEGGK